MEQAEWILLPQAAEQVSEQILESTRTPETELPPRR
jgi:hypothetical protein